jgi:tRNA(Arg) A34 adenosine deaminase TadA
MQTEGKYMALAIAEAQEASKAGEVPVGAVLVDARNGDVIATGRNRMRADNDPTAHAEVVALRAAAAKLGEIRLTDCDLYVTLEPCAMCAGAISLARVRRVYFGAYDAKGGAVEHGPRFFTQPTCHHTPEVYGGISEQDCALLLRDFFVDKRQ